MFELQTSVERPNKNPAARTSGKNICCDQKPLEIVLNAELSASRQRYAKKRFNFLKLLWEKN